MDVSLHLSVTAPVIVSARWQREGKEAQREFILPLRVTGSCDEVLRAMVPAFEILLGELVAEVSAAESSAARGYQYRFPHLELLRHAELKRNATPAVHIPEPSEANKAAVKAMHEHFQLPHSAVATPTTEPK